MDCLHITGGVALRGTVAVGGAKNAALPIMAASILASGPVRLLGVPDLADVDTLALLLGHLGVEVRARHRRRGAHRNGGPDSDARRIRSGAANARQLLRPWPAHRAPRRRHRVAARRLQHRHAAGRSASGRANRLGLRIDSNTATSSPRPADCAARRSIFWAPMDRPSPARRT